MPISAARSRTATPSTPRAAKSRSAASRISSRVGAAARPGTVAGRPLLFATAVATDGY